jgi:hypothetical protein
VSKEKVDEKDPLGDTEQETDNKVTLRGDVVEQPKVNESVVINKPKGKRVRIVIEESDDENSSSDVFVSVNGYGYQIRRGIPIEVPEEVVGVLNHAVTTKMVQNMETYEMTYRDVSRYNFKILS